MTIKIIPEGTKTVVVPGSVHLELAAEEAALIHLLVANVGGCPSQIRGIADGLYAMFKEATGMQGYDIDSDSWNSLTSEIKIYFGNPDGKKNEFFQKLVNSFKRAR